MARKKRASKKANLLTMVLAEKPRSNNFDLSHNVKMSGNMGNLMPILAMECVPGDHVQLSCETLIRLAPMVAPMMHRVDVYVHYFFVPNRLVWDNWENYITNTKVDDALPAFPTLTYGTGGYTKLMDYMGLPQPQGANTVKVSAIPFAAYQLIYNEYYRDQNLIDPVEFELVDGANDLGAGFASMRKRAWEHDYFTASLPFAQKGDAVEIPISGQLTYVGNGKNQNVRNATNGAFVNNATNLNTGTPFGQLQADDGGDVNVNIDLNGTHEVQNADTTINDLRRATALQKFLEKLARGGSRYIEVIRSMFGVHSSDKRLQRPEYITGMKSPIMISEVLNTTGTVDAPQGAMAGHGAGVAQGQYGSYYCEEHGYIMGIMSVMPTTCYQQGVPKHFLKTNNPYEFYFPDFANIGEQEVLNQEIYVDSMAPNGTFGYLPRYTEYKVMHDRVVGDFKNTLDFWHMGRIFETEPQLNEQFISADPTHRVFAVTDPNQDKLWIGHHNHVVATRLMPKFGTPSF